MVAIRHSYEKFSVPLDQVAAQMPSILEKIRDEMFEKARANRDARTAACQTLDEIRAVREKNGDGFIEAMWCGDPECEDRVKAETGVGSRCVPFAQKHIGDKCVCCGKPAKQMVLWAVAY